ncbi:MAG TPA: hypothetical protein VN493_10700 [Thermoanaerobaculia bacterium]|nr:hypothetical protein [Thermoanaerobaculia bacterium]
MKKTLWTAAALLAATLPAHAGVSIDRTSPSIGGCGFVVTPAHVYRLVPPGGGCDVGGAGPQVEVRPPSYGLGAMDNIDAVSANTATSPKLRYYLVFSGDRASVGQAGTPFSVEAAGNQAASDLFRTLLTTGSPAAAMGGGGICGAASAVPPPHFLHRNQTDFNLIRSVTAGVIQDNIDGIELDVLDITPDQFHDFDTYLSLDAASPALGGGSPAMIFFAPVGAGAIFAYAFPGQLGLMFADDIDSLVVWDRGVLGVADPALDIVLFSLAPGSPTLAAIGGSPADIFVSNLTGAFCLYVPFNQLGLLPADNVDGLDVIH